jgi:hypothetical protein
MPGQAIEKAERSLALLLDVNGFAPKACPRPPEMPAGSRQSFGW